MRQLGDYLPHSDVIKRSGLVLAAPAWPEEMADLDDVLRSVPARHAEGTRRTGWWNGRRMWFTIRNASALADVLLLILAPLVAARLVLGQFSLGSLQINAAEGFLAMSVVALATTQVYRRRVLHSPFASVLRAAAGILVAGLAAVLIWGSGERMAAPTFLWLSATVALGILAVAAAHGGVSLLVVRLARAGVLAERAVIVGADGRTTDLMRHYRQAAAPEVQIVGIFDDRLTRVPKSVEGCPVLGTTDDLVSYVRAFKVDRVILTLPWSAVSRITDMVTKLRQLPVCVDMVPHSAIWGYQSDIKRVSGIPVITVANHRLDGQLGIVKRAEDLLLGSLMVLALSPVFLAVAAAIKLDSRGPVLFRQKRVGFNNREFTVYKFRSMYHNQSSDPAVKQASKGDSRITRVGRILRRTSLDELPQLFNVIEGTMSIVGPRPHAVPHHVQYGESIDAYCARHNVKPGITGWAQVMGLRGETDTDEKMRARVESDIHYIENWSLGFDIKIIIMTGLKVWFQKTAY